MLSLLPCLRAARTDHGTVTLVAGVEAEPAWHSLCKVLGTRVVGVAANPANFLTVLDRSLKHSVGRRDVVVQVPEGVAPPALAQLIHVLKGSAVPVSELRLAPIEGKDDLRRAAALVTRHIEQTKTGRAPLGGSVYQSTTTSAGTSSTTASGGSTTTTTGASTDTTTTSTGTSGASGASGSGASTGTSGGSGASTGTTSSGGATTTTSSSTASTPSTGTSSSTTTPATGTASSTTAATTGTTATSGTATTGPCTTSSTTSGVSGVTTVTYSGNNWYRQAIGVGTSNGGQCTCPDGSVYMVGDYNNSCKSLACEGGSAGACSANLPAQAAGMKVTCGWPQGVPKGPTSCAGEDDMCYCNGTVLYTDGLGNAAVKQVNGGIRCNNDNFGDPHPGVGKFCICDPGPGVLCAADGGTCACKGTVYYGAGSNWTSIPGTGSVACSKTTFGTDPSGLGSGNNCYCKTVFTKCADQNGTCTCNGDVQFGTDFHWTPPRTNVGNVECSTDVFGDPFWGRSKSCYCRQT